MNWLRGIGLIVVLGVLGVVITVLFFSSPREYVSVVNTEVVGDSTQKSPIDASNQEEKRLISSNSKTVEDPVEAYHKQVLSHVAGSRFEGVYARYRETKDLELLGVLIDSGLEGGEYEILRDELSAVAVDTVEVAKIVGPQRILKTLFTVTPLTFKSYELLKNIVDRYESQGLITKEEKNFWYSLVALSKGHTDDFRYYVNLTNDPQWISLIKSVEESQRAYTYVPEWWGLALYGVAMYEAGYYRVSQNIASLLQKQDPTYVVGYQLASWSNLQLHQRSRAEKAAQKTLQYDNESDSKDQYLLIEAIAVYNQGDYARSALLFNQLERSNYSDYAVRYAFKIAKETNQGLSSSIKKLSTLTMTPSDYYEVIDLLYPPFRSVSQESIQEINVIINQCKKSIASSYSYICIMGKAGVLYATGEKGKSKLILKQVTAQYPTGQARELLGEIYQQLGESNEAKDAFIQSLRFAQDKEDQQRLLPRIQILIADT